MSKKKRVLKYGFKKFILLLFIFIMIILNIIWAVKISKLYQQNQSPSSSSEEGVIMSEISGDY